MFEGSVSCSAENNLSASALRQFTMAADEISVQVSFDNVFNFEPMRGRFVDVFTHVALWIDYRPLACRTNQVRGVCQTAKIKLLEIHKCPDAFPFCLSLIPDSPS